MLKNLPAQDLISFHVFLYFINIKRKINFFNGGTFDKEAQTITALLSIDAFGNVFENHVENCEVIFTLTFSLIKHREYINSHEHEHEHNKNDSPDTRFTHYFLVQAAPQLYIQAFTFTQRQLSIKSNCLTKFKNISKQKETEVFSIYQKIMIPMVVKGRVVKLH